MRIPSHLYRVSQSCIAHCRSIGLASLLFTTTSLATSEQPFTIESDGWVLHGGLSTPADQPPRAFALLFHKAAGNRQAYSQMAATLASNEIASLRVDLRGHGESTNLGAFDPELSRYYNKDDPAVVANFELIRAGDEDILTVLRWLEEQPGLSDLPLIMMGSSYTGEEMAEASAAHG